MHEREQTKVGDLWYRYYDLWFGGDHVHISLAKHRVQKVTRCGVWLEPQWYAGRKHFVLFGARKRYAYPTIELARASFTQRKECQIAILKHKLERAQNALKLAQGGKWEEDAPRHSTFEFGDV